MRLLRRTRAGKEVHVGDARQQGLVQADAAGLHAQRIETVLLAILGPIRIGDLGGGFSHGRSPEFRYLLNSDLPFDEGTGTFIVPVCSGRGVESLEFATRRIRRGCRIVQQIPLPLDALGQRAEQIHVVLAAEEHDRFRGIGRQHAQIVIPILLAPAFVLIGAGAKRDVIGRRQKIRRNQTPACGENIEALQPISVGQKCIGSVLIELPRRQQTQRVVPWIVIISEQRGSP